MQYLIALIIVLTGFFPAAIYTKSLIQILFTLLFAPKFDMKCTQISIFGWTFIQQNGKWHRSCKDYFVPLIQYNATLDLSRYQAGKSEKGARNYDIVRVSLLLVISLVLLLLNLGTFRELVYFPKLHPLKLFSLSFTAGMIYQSVSLLCIGLYAYLVMMKGLTGYTDSILNRLRSGESFETLEMKYVDELPYPKANRIERMMYHGIYLLYLIAVKRYSDMKPVITEMAEYYKERPYILQDTTNYYLLVFYYSALAPDEELAECFFDKVRSTLETDPDANAKRVLACYYLNIVKDHDMARQYTDAGLRAVNHYSEGSERELERRLLLELHTTLVSIGLKSEVLP